MSQEINCIDVEMNGNSGTENSNEKTHLHPLILSVVPENEDGEQIKKVVTSGDVNRIPVYVVLDNDPQKVEGVINIDGDEVVELEGSDQVTCSKGHSDFSVKNTEGAEIDIQRLQKTDSESDLNLVPDDVDNGSLDDSNFSENILANLAKQVAFQQHYLSLTEFTPDNCGSDKQNQILCEVQNQPDIVDQLMSGSTCQNSVHMSGDYQTAHQDAVSGGYSILPSLLNEPPVSTATWFPVTLTPTSGPQIISNNTSQHPGSVVPRRRNKQNQQVMTSTPIGTQRVSQPVKLDGSGRFVYTPHPKTGQFLYVSKISDTDSQKLVKVNPVDTSASTQARSDHIAQVTTTPNIRVETDCKKLRLNSSGEESQSSPDFQPEQQTSSSDDSNLENKLTFEFSLISSCEEGRATHNLKERKRRARIKDACDVMRKLVPGMSDKTDKATVFEFAARYIHYLKGFIGNKHDKDFLLKYSPY